MPDLTIHNDAEYQYALRLYEWFSCQRAIQADPDVMDELYDAIDAYEMQDPDVKSMMDRMDSQTPQEARESLIRVLLDQTPTLSREKAEIKADCIIASGAVKG